MVRSQTAKTRFVTQACADVSPGKLSVKTCPGYFHPTTCTKVIHHRRFPHKVECMSCRVESSRNAYQADLARLNARWISEHSPELTEATGMNDPASSATAAAGTGQNGADARRLRADGDADVEPGAYLEDFVVPPCVRCGGVLKV